MPVTEEQIQAAIARRTTSGVTDADIQAAIQRKQQSQFGTGDKVIQPPSTGLSETARTGIETQFRQSRLLPERATELIQQLGGRFPSTQEEQLQKQVFQPRVTSIQAPRSRQRQEAFDELKQFGFSEDRIRGALAFEQATKEPSPLPAAGAAALTSIGVGALLPVPEELATVPAAAFTAFRAALPATAATGARAIQAGFDPILDLEAKDLLKTFKREFGTELLLGEVPGLLGRKVFGGLKRSATPRAAILQEKLQAATVKRLQREGVENVPAGFTRGAFKFKPKEVGFLPADLIQDKTLGLAQEITETGLLASERIAETRRLSRLGGLQIADDLADSVVAGASRQSIDDVVNVAVDSIAGQEQLFKATGSKLFKNIDEITEVTETFPLTQSVASNILDESGRPLTRNVTRQMTLQELVNVQGEAGTGAIIQKLGREGKLVDIRSYKKIAQDEIARLQRTAGAGTTPEIPSFLKRAAGLEGFQGGPNLGDFVTYETAQDLRSASLSDVRRFGSQVKIDQQAFGISKRFAKTMNTSIQSSAKRLGPEASEAFEVANKFWREGRTRFGKRVVRRLMTNEDARVGLAQSIFKPRNVTQINAVKEAMGPDAFNKLKGAWLQGLVDAAQQPDALATATGKGLPLGTKILKGFNALDDNAGTLGKLFTKKQIETFRDGARILALLERPAEKTAAGALRIVQVGAGVAALGIAASPLTGESDLARAGLGVVGLTLISPLVLSRFLTDPKKVKLLIEGSKPIAEGIRTAPVATVRLLRAVRDERKAVIREQQQLIDRIEKEDRLAAIKARERERGVRGITPGL